MTLKQRREVLKNYHGKDLYTKLATMNLGATSSASRIMLLNLEEGNKEVIISVTFGCTLKCCSTQ